MSSTWLVCAWTQAQLLCGDAIHGQREPPALPQEREKQHCAPCWSGWRRGRLTCMTSSTIDVIPCIWAGILTHPCHEITTQVGSTCHTISIIVGLAGVNMHGWEGCIVLPYVSARQDYSQPHVAKTWPLLAIPWAPHMAECSRMYPCVVTSSHACL